ncbi:hypothetical protein Bca52824_055356 [Brassica carinata]|uniref:Uncharacterized protein n=1 Tax=Brassica carinata TaxID=52824 RepID=A0A8X7UPX9_BRACI|nr:hypothetical protein Bca52824_055356 [Brassica carinata]
MIIGQRLSRWLSYDLGVQGEGSPQQEYEAAGGEVLVDDEDDDGWLATHGKPKDKGNEDENLPSMVPWI